jgi:competence protein ComGC
MEMLIVRVTTSILSVTFISSISRPDSSIEDEVVDSFILFKPFKEIATINPVFRVMG